MLQKSTRLIIVLVLAIALYACKKDEVIEAEEETTFAVDPDFEKELFRQRIDNTLNGLIRYSEIKKVDSLDLRRINGIKSLKGIEHFENLKSLFIFDVKIDSLDLSKNTKLEYLFCKTIGMEGEAPSLTYLNVKNCQALKFLDCSNNLLSELDVRGNPALTFLAFSANYKIKEIDLSANVALDSLECKAPLSLTELDLNKNSKLRRVNFQGTSIQSLDLSMLSNLKAVDVRFSSVSEIKLKTPALLEELEIMGAKISFPDPGIFSKLQTLDFGAGQFSTNLSSLPDLKILNVSFVKATTIDLSGNKNLETLTLYESAFNEINLANNTKLKAISLFNLSNLTAIDVSHAINLTFFGSTLNRNLKTICVTTIPDPLSMNWHKDDWSTYVVCK